MTSCLGKVITFFVTLYSVSVGKLGMILNHKYVQKPLDNEEYFEWSQNWVHYWGYYHVRKTMSNIGNKTKQYFSCLELSSWEKKIFEKNWRKNIVV